MRVLSWVNVWLCVAVTDMSSHPAGWTVRHHTIVSYGLYTMGFLLFVMSLKKQTLLYQARPLCCPPNRKHL